MTGDIVDNLGQSKALHPGIAELHSEDTFGEFCLFDDLPACADVIAKTDVALLRIPHHLFKDWLDKHPETGYQIYSELLQNLIHRIRKTNLSLINLYSWGIKSHDISKYL